MDRIARHTTTQVAAGLRPVTPQHAAEYSRLRRRAAELRGILTNGSLTDAQYWRARNELWRVMHDQARLEEVL